MTREELRTIRFITLSETVAQSIAKDAFSLGSMAALSFFNHAYLDGSWLIDAFIIICVIGFWQRHVTRTLNRSPKMTFAELRDWVNSVEPDSERSGL